MRRAAQVTARETQRVWLIRQRWHPGGLRCEQCATPVQTCTPTEAAAIIHTDAQTINSLIERGQLHWQATADGACFICLNSLFETDPRAGMSNRA